MLKNPFTVGDKLVHSFQGAKVPEIGTVYEVDGGCVRFSPNGPWRAFDQCERYTVPEQVGPRSVVFTTEQLELIEKALLLVYEQYADCSSAKGEQQSKEALLLASEIRVIRNQ